MKELIRKFARESGLEIYGLGARRDKWEHTMEKFTELVVKECTEVCKKQSFHYAEHNNQGSAASAADVCRILINQHFGVEE